MAEEKTQSSESAGRKNFQFFCWKSCQRAGIVCLEGCGILAVLLALAMGLALWRLTSGPVNINFAKDLIISALDDPNTALRPEIDNFVLYWPDLRGPLLLGMRDVRLIEGSGQPVLSVEEVSLSLVRSQLFLGRIAPKALILTQPSLRIMRAEDGSVNLSFGKEQTIASEETAKQAGAQTAFTTQILEIVARPGTEKDESLPLAYLEGFEVRDAKVTIEDHTLGMTWFLPELDISFLSTQKGLRADMYLALPGGKDETASIRARADYDWDSKKIAVTSDLKALESRMFASKISTLSFLRDFDFVVDAKIKALLGRDFYPENLEITALSEEGTFYVEDFYPEETAFEKAAFRVLYDKAAKKFSVKEAALSVKGVTLKAQADLTHNEDFTQILGPVSARIDEVAHEKLDPVWPASLREDNSYRWIVERQSDGILKDVGAALDFRAQKDEEQKWVFDFKDLRAEFAFDGMTIDYRAPMIPVTGARGRGSFDYDQEFLSVHVERAALADMDIEGANLEFRNIIQKGKGLADISLHLKGPLKTAFAYLEKEPIDLDEEIHFDLDQVKGAADLKINLNFPTISDLRTEQVKIDLAGTVTNAFIPDLVEGLPLSGGPFEVAVNNEFYTVKGAGALADRPCNFTWKEFLNSQGQPFSAQATAEITIDPNLRAHFGADLSLFLEGSVPAAITYTQFQDGRARADVKIDMSPARFFVESFGYEKKPGLSGEAQFQALIRNKDLQEIKALSVNAPDFHGEKANITFAGAGKKRFVRQAQFPEIEIGETQGKIDFETESSGRLKVIIEGPKFDLRPFLKGARREENTSADVDAEKDPILLSIQAGRMITADNQTIRQGKIYADLNAAGRFNQLEMDGVAGSGDIYLRYKPDETGAKTFRFEADDAGATLAAFNVSKNVRGGTLIISGAPVPGDYTGRNMRGLAQMRDFKSVNAPGLARLLGAMSLPGLIGTLKSDGIAFERLEAAYDWMYRPQGSIINVKDGRTSGSALGLTFQGSYDTGAQMMDLSGTIVPLSTLNKMLSNIPLVGEILSGGSESVFAATYTMKGKGDDPEVSVNPLAALTPGILRKILFE